MTAGDTPDGVNYKRIPEQTAVFVVKPVRAVLLLDTASTSRE
jgi:hypothetical protein